MTAVLQREANTITLATFWENYLLNKYNFSPAYQRKSVWTEEKQSFFIDSILRNFPVPPIFLHQQIDDETGRTIYDVIDGKQRLESIIKFIKGEIPVFIETPEGEAEADVSGDKALAGAYFADLDKPNLQEHKKRFWRYVIPIEYIDTKSKDLIDDIFDRLNRNGEPLKGQELRHAQYHSTELMKTVRKLADLPFWKDRLKNVDVARMEDQEFVSEMIFVLLEGGPLEADQSLMDKMYEKYTKADVNWTNLEVRFGTATEFLEKLNLDYDGLKISGTSHLYGLWCFSAYCVSKSVPVDQVRIPVRGLFLHLRQSDEFDETVEQYRKSMSFNTRSRAQRVRRLDALKQYAQV